MGITPTLVTAEDPHLCLAWMRQHGCPSLSGGQAHHLQGHGYRPCPCPPAGCQRRVMLDPQPSTSPVPAAPSPGPAEHQQCSLCPLVPRPGMTPCLVPTASPTSSSSGSATRMLRFSLFHTFPASARLCCCRPPSLQHLLLLRGILSPF